MQSEGRDQAPTFSLRHWKRERESKQTKKYGGNHFIENDFYSGKASPSAMTRKFSVSRNYDVDDSGFYIKESHIQRDL